MLTIKYLFVWTAILSISGCANAPVESVAQCTVPVTRTDAMNIKHNDCAVWVFGGEERHWAVYKRMR